jgi:hypothetical protein
MNPNPSSGSEEAPALSRNVAIAPPRKISFLVLAILASVLFTPTFRLPGAVPVRLDDLIVFGCGAILGVYELLHLSIPRLDRVSFYLTLLLFTILLSTISASWTLNFNITAKEYLDLLRPLKFLLVYWIVRKQDRWISLQTFTKTISVSMWILLLIAMLEMALARIGSGGPILRAFAVFADNWSPDQAQAAMAERPFATFNTPTHLGYVAAIGFFLASVLPKSGSRRFLVVTSFLALLISVTRTLLFSLPLLMMVQPLLGDYSLKKKFRSLGSRAAIIVLLLVIGAALLPLVSPVAANYTNSMIHAIFSGNTDDEYSITTRLSNLALVTYTWQVAPVLGVATRSLLPDYVDSELIVVFHRYGSLGLLMLLVFYLTAYKLARQARLQQPALSQFAVMTLAITFLYGLTQGALINSRIGVIPFVVLGILEPWARLGNATETQKNRHWLWTKLAEIG